MMGILATVMNALALESALEKAGAAARTMSALTMPELCESYERRRALRGDSTSGAPRSAPLQMVCDSNNPPAPFFTMTAA